MVRYLTCWVEEPQFLPKRSQVALAKSNPSMPTWVLRDADGFPAQVGQCTSGNRGSRPLTVTNRLQKSESVVFYMY